MALTYDLWFPNGAAISSFYSLTANGVFDLTPGEDPARCFTTTDPLGSGETVLCLKAPQSDAAYNGVHRTTLAVADGDNNGAEPITDWTGESASRRWYRFAFLLPSSGWPQETQQAAAQFCVVWQLHETNDTSPADVVAEPTLWLKESRDGRYMELWNCADPNAQTALATRTYRLLYREPIVFDVWHEWIIYMKASWTSGDISIWRNRRKVFSETGQVNTFNNDESRGGGGNVPLLDVYNGTGTQDRTVYHKGIQIGDEAYATFDDFAAALGTSLEREAVVPVRSSMT